MQTMVPLYGFGGGGGTGAALTVNAPAGATVTVSKDGKTKTRTAGADGVSVFKGLATGDWTLSITDGEQTAQKTVTITADYSAAITFFAATIHITYPAGSICTATDGVTTITAPDTSGTWDCVVPNAGTWTVSLDSSFESTVEITQNGEKKTIDKWYLYNRGDQCTKASGGWKSAGNVKFNSDCIRMVGNYATRTNILANMPIPIGFKTLTIVGYVESNINGVSFQSCGLTNINGNNNSCVWNYGTVGAFTKNVDISSVLGIENRYTSINVGEESHCIGIIYEIYVK